MLFGISPSKATFLAFVKPHLSIFSISMSNAKTFIHEFMTSRLYYCNALLGGCSECLINKLQMVQNAAARVLTRHKKYGHISPVLSTLHWLPIKYRIYLKILLIPYKALNFLAPQYLSKLILHYSPSCPLHSQNSGYLIIPRISKSNVSSRSFSYLVPTQPHSRTNYLALFGRQIHSVNLNLD